MLVLKRDERGSMNGNVGTGEGYLYSLTGGASAPTWRDSRDLYCSMTRIVLPARTIVH